MQLNLGLLDRLPETSWHTDQQYRYMELLSNRLEIHSPEEWHRVRMEHVQRVSSASIWRLYSHGIMQALCSLYADYEWQPWISEENPPYGFWESLENRKKYAEWLCRKLNIESHEDWYNVKTYEVVANHGASILKTYSGSLHSFLCEVYPHIRWHAWRFNHSPKGYWDNLENRYEYMYWLADRLKVTTPEKWYEIDISTIKKNQGHSLTYIYEDSIYNLLSSLFPEYEWQAWIFEASRDAWDTEEHKRLFLDWYAKIHDIRDERAWSRVTLESIRMHGGSKLVQHNSSVFKLLCSAYPVRTWHPWIFEPLPDGFFDTSSHRICYFDWLANEFHVQNSLQWHRVRPSEVQKLEGGFSFLKFFKHSWENLLCSLVPGYTTVDPQIFWTDDQNVHNFLEYVATKLKVQNPERWYSVKHTEVKSCGGSMLLKLYDNRLSNVLYKAYPEYPWCYWQYHSVSPGFWDSFNNHVRFFDWLGNELRIEDFSMWYHVHSDDVFKLGGQGLLKKYDGSLIRALMTCYPHYAWQPWRFDQTFRGFWNDQSHIDSYLQWLAKELDVHTKEDIYSVTYEEVMALKGYYLVSKYGLCGVLQKCFPQFELEQETFYSSEPVSKAQKILYRALTKLLWLDQSEILSNFSNSRLIFPSYKTMELDIFIPTLQLAFEYQGQQHFGWNHKGGTPLVQQARDKEKQDACLGSNITIIYIPYWWDKGKQSLTATIHRYRPDVINFAGNAKPIPLLPHKTSIKPGL